MPYFPTDQDWTLVTRPSKVPLDVQFPKHLAVNPIPSGSNCLPLRPRPGHSAKSTPSNAKGKEKESVVDVLMNRSQPNLVSLSRRREAGELSDAANHDSLLEQTDMAAIEETLGLKANSPYMARGWSDLLNDTIGF